MKEKKLSGKNVFFLNVHTLHSTLWSYHCCGGTTVCNAMMLLGLVSFSLPIFFFLSLSHSHDSQTLSPYPSFSFLKVGNRDKGKFNRTMKE